MIPRVALLFLLTLQTNTFARDSTGIRAPIAAVDSASTTPPVPRDPFDPADSASAQAVHPRFSWPAVPGAQWYRLEVATDSAFTSFAVRDSLPSDTTLRCEAPLLNDSLYFWRVGWQDLSGNLTYSSARRFHVASPPSFSSPTGVFPPSRSGEAIRINIALRNPVADTIAVDSVMSRSGAFRVAAVFPAVLLPNDSLRLDILFCSSYFKTYSDTLVVFTSQGTARLPLIAEVPPPFLGPTVSSIRFGSIKVHETAEVTIPLRNIGLFNDLSILRILTRTPFFVPSRESSFRIGPEDSMGLVIRFSVKAIRGEGFGIYDDTLTIVSDAGIARVALNGDAPPPRIAVAPHSMDFGLVATLDSAFAPLRIRNRSINVLRIDSIKAKSQAFTPVFFRGSVSRADTLLLTVKFLPDRYGLFADTLFVYSNSWISPMRIPMQGYSPCPILETDYERVNFGAVGKGDSGGVAIRLWNSSISFLRIDSIKSRTGQFRVEELAMPKILRLGDAILVRLGFYPDSYRKFEDTLEILNNSEQWRYTVPLVAEGIPSRNETLQTVRSSTYQLFQNYPNPFSSATTFSYNLPRRSHVRLEVFTTLGQRIATVVEGEQEAGVQNISWEADITSGVYYYRFYAIPVDEPSKHYFESRKMMLIR